MYRSRSMASFTACWELGVGIGAIAFGGLADAVGFTLMLLVVATLPVLGLLTLPWLRDRPLQVFHLS